MKTVRVLLIAALCQAYSLSAGQVPKGNPLVTASQKIGEVGLVTDSVAAKDGWAFKPSGKRDFIKAHAKIFSDVASEQEALEKAMYAIVDQYEAIGKQLKQENDPATALAFSVAILHSLATGNELPQPKFLEMTGRFRSVLSPVTASNEQKQEFYEWVLSSASSLIVLGGTATTPDSVAKIKTLATAQLKALTGAELSQFDFSGETVKVKGSAKPIAAPISKGGLAPGFQINAPAPWREVGGWWVNEKLETRNVVTQACTAAHVRFLPAIEAKGNMGDALRSLWKSDLPAEMEGKAGAMVYRRYVGNGLFAQFIFGMGQEKGRRTDTFFTLMLVDCGSYWQPVVIGQTYEDRGEVLSGESLTAGFSYPVSSAQAETLLSSFRCSGAPVDQPIAVPASLAGEYNFGNGSTMEWVNIYTGATSMTFVSYGGSLNLAANGTFTYA